MMKRTNIHWTLTMLLCWTSTRWSSCFWHSRALMKYVWNSSTVSLHLTHTCLGRWSVREMRICRHWAILPASSSKTLTGQSAADKHSRQTLVSSISSTGHSLTSVADPQRFARWMIERSFYCIHQRRRRRQSCWVIFIFVCKTYFHNIEICVVYK